MKVPIRAHIYLIQDGADIGSNIYKVGRTRNLNARLANYSKGTNVIRVWAVDEKRLEDIECEVISKISKTNILARGKEWFTGDPEQMKTCIEACITNLGVADENQSKNYTCSYTCRRCKYTTSLKANMRKHLQRKTPCVATNEDVDPLTLLAALDACKSGYECEHCNSSFKTSQSKYQHKLKCKQKRLEKKIDNLEHILQQKQPQQHITNHIQNQNIQIIIRDVDSANVSDSENVNENVNKEHRKKHNLETHVDGRWIVTDSDETLTELIKSGYRVLIMHSRKHKAKIMEDELDDDIDEFDRLRDWLEVVYDDKREQAPLKRKLLLLFLNNKALLLEKESTD